MSDPQAPRRMPWEEYKTRLLAAFAKGLDAEGARTRREVFDELWDLLGCPWVPELCLRLQSAPLICPGCLKPFRSALPDEMCGDCIDKAATAAERERIKAEVRAELAQKGGT